MNPPKILLVEDNEELGQAYIARFQAEGMETAWTKNGEEALAETVRFKPNLLILDIMMPRISGFDVLDILKNTPETRDVKIIVLSALSSPEDIEKARMLGANDYLVKAQVTVADVVDAIRRHLGTAAGPAPTTKPPSPAQAPTDSSHVVIDNSPTGSPSADTNSSGQPAAPRDIASTQASSVPADSSTKPTSEQAAPTTPPSANSVGGTTTPAPGTTIQPQTPPTDSSTV